MNRKRDYLVDLRLVYIKMDKLTELTEKYNRLVQRQVELQEEKTKVDTELDSIVVPLKIAKEEALIAQFVDDLQRDGIYIGKGDEFDDLWEPAKSKFTTMTRACNIHKYRFNRNLSEFSDLRLECMTLPKNSSSAELNAFHLLVEKLTPHFPISTEVFHRSKCLHDVRFKTTLPIKLILDEGAVMTVWSVDDIHSFRQKLADNIL